MALALGAAPGLAAGPVLDLGCGAGRHLEVLRRTNPQAFGMDLSPSLLRLAPADLHPWLLRGDMRALPVKDGALSGVCLWFTPFGYFSDDQNRALMLALGRVLRPGGALVMDYLNAGLVARALVPEDTLERAGVRVLSRRAIEGGRIVKRMTLTHVDTGETREAIESVRLYLPSDLEAMAAGADMRLRTVRGTYAGGAFTEDSPRWIGIFEKAR